MKCRRILVVDDDRSLRRTTRLILRHRGYEVSEARNGDEALALARENGFELILMDIRMPGMSGIEVFEQLEGERPPKVLFMSAYAVDADVERALEAGAVEVLRKPVDVDLLLALIERYCGETSAVSAC